MGVNVEKVMRGELATFRIIICAVAELLSSDYHLLLGVATDADVRFEEKPPPPPGLRLSLIEYYSGSTAGVRETNCSLS